MRTPAGETPHDVIGELAAHVFEAPDVSLAATPDYTTRAETATGDLRNALQILGAQAVLLPVGSTPTVHEVVEAVKELLRDSAAVARLLRQALEKLEAK